MTATTQQMRNTIDFMRLNIRNFDDGLGGSALEYLTATLNMFDDAANQLDALQAKLDESDALKAQQENQHADAYTAGYDAGEEAASRDISSLRAQLANMTAERDALAAVPVAAIHYHWLNSRMDVFEIDIHSEEYRKYCAAEDTIEAWLPKQVVE